MQQTNNDLLKQYQPHQSGGGGNQNVQKSLELELSHLWKTYCLGEVS